MSVLESQAHKKLRSFALFPAKKRAKYESAYGLFAAAARSHLANGNYSRAADCLKNQARIAINKLQLPVESATHYMEATRAYMLADELADAFECLQLAVSARTKPHVKHKGDALELQVSGITVHEGPAELRNTKGNVESEEEDQSMVISPDTYSNAITPHGLSPSTFAVTRSPALTSQAGTIQIEGRGLKLSEETMEAPISSNNAPRSLHFNYASSSSSSMSGPSSTLFGSTSLNGTNPAANSATSSSSLTAAASSSGIVSSQPSPPRTKSSSQALSVPPPRFRRHSLSGSANSSNVTTEGVVHEVLHIDLLLARLAVQLATDLWTDLDFRDAILALEIASSLFATLLIAERNTIGGTFRRSRIVSPLLPIVDPPLIRSESAQTPQPETPNVIITPVDSKAIVASSLTLTPAMMSSLKKSSSDQSTSAIEERLATLLGPNAYAMTQSSQTLGAFTAPISAKPIPSRLSSLPSTKESEPDAHALVLHLADPHLSVGEGEDWDKSVAPTILEESLICRFQLANYYCRWDDELGHEERSMDNQELRRSKALFEQVASSKPDQALVHATLLPILTQEFDTTNVGGMNHPPSVIDHIATVVADYAADDDKLNVCLFLAGLCDALIGIRVYQASQVKVSTSTSTTLNAKALKNGKKLSQSHSTPPPPVPELYLMTRTVYCPSILLRYRSMSASFGHTCEIRLLRALNGLLQLAANLPQRLNDAFGGAAPHVAKQLFQAAWGAEILREYSEVVAVYNKQRPMTSIVAKLLMQIKKEMKSTISG